MKRTIGKRKNDSPNPGEHPYTKKRFEIENREQRNSRIRRRGGQPPPQNARQRAAPGAHPSRLTRAIGCASRLGRGRTLWDAVCARRVGEGFGAEMLIDSLRPFCYSNQFAKHAGKFLGTLRTRRRRNRFPQRLDEGERVRRDKAPVARGASSNMSLQVGR